MRAEVEARIAALQPRLREAEALQQRLDQAVASGSILAAAQAEFGDALAVLDALTAVLPDDTFLTDLTLKQRQVALRGQSANAARLIAALSAEPALRNPSFAAPVTRAAGGGPDLFAIAAEAAP
jgi:general secretion pathway protein L